ncbi:MAG: hypothetical protein EZS28_019203 [Streblomastix strix]|uniref:Uncharacterized protein n=1 Tax=Streblomastix strix TaxID=222440 RepID=A0A5J4VRT9_9EUKA|nr:MAG: hypothetical protein EZS28_019203 [Streblomastix strix]
MKFNGNTADKAGQTMYVALTKVAEWCRTGTAGEYVKGNYTDGTSSKSELVGIPVDYYTFNSYSTAQVNSKQSYLEDYWNVDRTEYFVNSTGNDQSQCTSFQPCLTLDANTIKSNINNAKTLFVYIYDSASIGNTLAITQTATTRTFRNYPLTSTTQSNIAIKSEGQFSIIGNVRFRLIKFIIESSQTQFVAPGIYGIEFTAQIDLQDCEFQMQNGQPQIRKCFIQLLKGGSHAISNLKSKDISSLENIIKINFDQLGSISISDSQFENITRIGNTNPGGTIGAILKDSSNKLDISDCKFISCKSQDSFGGAIYAEIQNSNAEITLSGSQLIKCEAQRGGGIFVKIDKQGKLILENSCEIKQCKAASGNGGGIYADLTYSGSNQASFIIKDGLIEQCTAVTSSTITGYGGGIFIGGTGAYDPTSKTLDLKGMKINGNTASKGGQSLYAVMSKLKEWCRIGKAGEFVKGNYSDIDSDESDLEGIPTELSTFQSLSATSIQSQQRALEYYWSPRQSIYHILNRNGLEYKGQDQQWCGNWDEACLTIQYTIDQISINKGSTTTKVDEKQIGVSQYGYDLQTPIQFSKSGSHTDVVKIMKQLYGTPQQMSGNAEIKIIKNDDSKETGRRGWISAIEGLQLRFYYVNIIMDNSKLTIPIIYIDGSQSILELNTVTFSGIKLSPTSEPTGIVQINVDNSQLIASNSKFENIDIDSKGGNAIRIVNSGSNPITATLDACEFNSINSIGDSSGRGGSAIYMESKHGSKLIIDDSCQFLKCVVDKGNGGAIYADIDYSSQFQFKINDGLIQECQAKSDAFKDVPPTGYGGGIYITGSGDYVVLSKGLDFKGLRINKNKADKAGQSIYIVMTKVAELCQYGTEGEYVKGNYVVGESDKNELQGIPVDSTTFNSYSTEKIKQEQNYLEDYWNINRDEYFIQSTGSNSWLCSSSSPCLTLEASTIQNNINNETTIYVYIFDSTSIENALEITQTATTRTFRNYPLDKTQTSDIAIKSEGRFNIIGNVRFRLIKFIIESSQTQFVAPGIYGNEQTAQIDLQDCEFQMQNAQSQIRKCFIYLLKGGSHAISNLKSKDISSLENIIKINFDQEGSISISDSQFENITRIGNTNPGGTIGAILKDSSNKLDISDCKFISCKSQDSFGGAIYAEIQNSNAEITLSGSQLIKCEAQRGGGIFVKIDKQGKLILENSCEIKQCKAASGNGGGIYADLTYSGSNQASFIIKDGLIEQCTAVTSSTITGYGGGIFIGGTGAYDPTSKTLDLKGMKINGNTASKGGQSLYAVMSKLKEWCRIGKAGEFVKGNYSDIDSDLSQLKGIPQDLEYFNTLPSEEIEEQQNYLQYYWSQIAILTQANAVLNESNVDLPLQITLKGSNFIAGQFFVKIVDLGPKTQFNKKIALIQDNVNDVIYAPEDGSGKPIDIQGDPQSEQEATFGMKDISWMDYKNRNYGMLASNDRRIFTGVGGKYNKALPMEVNVEEIPIIDESDTDGPVIDDKPGKSGIPLWATVLIIVSALSLLAGIILSALCCLLCPCCFCFKCWDKDDQRVKRVRDDFEYYKIEHQKILREILFLDLLNKGSDSEMLLKAKPQSVDSLMRNEKLLFARTSYSALLDDNQESALDENQNNRPQNRSSKQQQRGVSQKSKQTNRKQTLVPYEQDERLLRNYGLSKDVGMTEFAKQPSVKGTSPNPNSLYSRNQGQLGTVPQVSQSMMLPMYTDNLRTKLDNLEKQEAQSQPSLPQMTRKSTKDYVEYPKQEKGTLNEKITDFFSQAKPTTIDFSAMRADDPQLRGINWGASGPPATLGLGAQGISKAPKQILELQQRQEKLLSKSSTNYQQPVGRKSPNMMNMVQQGRQPNPTNPITSSAPKQRSQSPSHNQVLQNSLSSKSPQRYQTPPLNALDSMKKNTQNSSNQANAQFSSQPSISPRKFQPQQQQLPPLIVQDSMKKSPSQSLNSNTSQQTGSGNRRSQSPSGLRLPKNNQV